MAINSVKFHKWNLNRLILATVVAGSVGINTARSENLVLQGSTTFTTGVALPLAGVVEAQTGHHLEIIPNKSSLGLLALLEHKADLAMISTTLEREMEILRKSDPGLPLQRLKAFEIVRTRAALVIHPDNPVRMARLQEIGKILTGEISNWKQLGGPDLPIRVVAVREGGGVLASVEARLLGAAHISAPDAIRVQVGTQIVRIVAQEPGAIGITQLAIVKSSSAVEMITDEPIEQILSLVSLDDPSPEAIATIEAFRRIANHGT
ncbi:MAG: substrate-binding domain-containing protein [Rhodopseudomonas sp.]|uniref:substrate-binding domain-containing protein n=1 Tax=Rhodopseudomonas sp. TaxID=1078 RepID=UPI0018343562|nr:substrate-binding domain-containing protein [Rhodopseudomonas sp.]NVN84459.1 substrate-binding domain-containing protein [Rhodopseudomonas sp.]